jgi:hypothetical protein
VGQVLRVTGASTFGWGQLDLADTDAVTGILPIGNVGTVTRDDVEVELITDQFCFVIKEPTNGLDIADHDISSIYSNRAKAITVTEVWCETDVGTATINLQRDDGTAANMLSSDLVCDTNEQDSCASGCDVNTIAAAEDNLAVDNEVDFVLVSVATAPKRVSMCLEYTID